MKKSGILAKVVARVIRRLSPLFPDKTYLTILYRCKMGHWINWNAPQTFNEKLQWLKIYDRRPEYITMVDKYAVKDSVAQRIGSEHIIPTIGVWNTPDEIDFDTLPNQFVLKTTHGGGSGGVVICRDKSAFDIKDAKKKLAHSLKADIYRSYREWPYKNVRRRIIAEELISLPSNNAKTSIDTGDNQLKDYKFFCFSGKPMFLKVDYDRFIEHHANYYDMSWNLLPFGEADLPPVEGHIEKCPPNFAEMVEIATRLAHGHKFIRIDLYNALGKVLFGEMTFYPASGMGFFMPEEWDLEIGNMLSLE